MQEACGKSASVELEKWSPNAKLLACPFIGCLLRHERDVLVNLQMKTGSNRTFYFNSIDADASLVSCLLQNKLAPIGSKVIFTWSPAVLWGKVCSSDRGKSKQKTRNVPLVSAEVHGGGRLRDEPKEGLRRRLTAARSPILLSLKSFIFLIAVWVNPLHSCSCGKRDETRLIYR